MKLLHSFILFLFCSILQAQNEFITTWEMTAGNLDLNIPANTNDYTYDYTVDFGDGTVLTNQTGNATHNYAAPGVYTVSILGIFPHLDGSEFNFIESYNLQSVEQWGNIQWQSMDRAFEDCSNLIINANDSPDLSQVTNMRSMFKDAESLNQPLNNWDVSNITNMSGLFLRASSFNQPLDNWNVSNVSDTSAMFNDADAFNQPIDNWDVSNVTDMTSMFRSADVFNQPLNSWDVSNVTDMRLMFQYAEVFNQALDNWDVSNVAWMIQMFVATEAFNQPINSWDVSNVLSMESMFSLAQAYNQPLNNWNVSNVTNMKNMFNQTESFDQPLNNWNVSNVTIMRNMFRAAESFNQPLNNWDVSSVVSMVWMFRDVESFNQPLDNWDVSNVSNMNDMFEDASSFNQNIGNWILNPSVSMNSMLSGSGLDCDNYTATLVGWEANNPNVINKNLGATTGMFYGTSAVTARNILVNDRGWNIVGDTASNDSCDAFLSTLDYNFENQVSIYPNPSSNFINIQLNENMILNQVNLYAISGKLIKTVKSNIIPVEDLNSGNYLLEVITNQGKASKIIIVK